MDPCIWKFWNYISTYTKSNEGISGKPKAWDSTVPGTWLKKNRICAFWVIFFAAGCIIRILARNGKFSDWREPQRQVWPKPSKLQSSLRKHPKLILSDIPVETQKALVRGARPFRSRPFYLFISSMHQARNDALTQSLEKSSCINERSACSLRKGGSHCSSTFFRRSTKTIRACLFGPAHQASNFQQKKRTNNFRRINAHWQQVAIKPLDRC